MTGMLRKLGWDQLRVSGREGPPWVKLPRQTAGELGRHIKTAMGLRTLRMFGDPTRAVSTVSLSGGMPGENMQIQQLESGADAVFLGEVREPEVLGYAQDMAADRQVTVYLVGHHNEDAGMGLIADWLKTVFPALPVQWLPTPDPYTNPS
jgi:putative NIF3 family GTP cyclohydrolase 1 type 2